MELACWGNRLNPRSGWLEIQFAFWGSVPGSDPRRPINKTTTNYRTYTFPRISHSANKRWGWLARLEGDMQLSFWQPCYHSKYVYLILHLIPFLWQRCHHPKYIYLIWHLIPFLWQRYDHPKNVSFIFHLISYVCQRCDHPNSYVSFILHLISCGWLGYDHPKYVYLVHDSMRLTEGHCHHRRLPSICFVKIHWLSRKPGWFFIAESTRIINNQ